MSSDYERVERAIRYLDEHVTAQPSLGDVADAVGLSPYHFQRLFTRWAGVSPKRFLEFLTVEYAKSLLDDARSVLDTAVEVGLSGPSRLHDHFVAMESVTPGQFKSGGESLVIRWGVHPSPFGDMFVAATARGVCRLGFVDGEGVEAPLADLRHDWPEAEMEETDRATGALASRVFAPGDGGRPPLHVRGTNFQINVWKALLRLPPGTVCSYGQLAASLGQPRAARAVGTAVGANPVACLIPCHRVIRSAGGTGKYHWGTARKRALLGWEAARASSGLAPVRPAGP